MCKRGLAWLLSVLMLLMAIPFGGLAVFATEPLPVEEGDVPVVSPQTLQLGVEATVVITENYERIAFLFTPEESGTYRLYSWCDMDTQADVYIVHPDWNEHIYGNDDGGINQNFVLDCEMEAGRLYRYEVAFMNDGTGQFPIMLEKTKATTCDEVLTDGQDTLAYFGAQSGEHATFLFTPEVDGSYDFAAQSNMVRLNVKNPDGFYQGREEYDYAAMTMHRYCTLEAGVTYRVEVYYDSYYEKGSVPMRVDRLKDYVSIEFHDLTLREGLDAVGLGSEFDDNGTEHHFTYYSYTPCFTVTWADGTTSRLNGYYFHSNAGRHDFQIQDTQGYKYPWKAGRLNQVTATLYEDNSTYTFAVNLTENPVASVEVADRTYIEHTNGSYHTMDIYDENGVIQNQVTYYHYYCDPESSDYVVTMKDGTVFHGTTFTWNGEEYRLPTTGSVNQSYENPLAFGTNTVDLWCAGLFFDFNVHIVASPVASVVVDPLYVIEGQHGYVTCDSLYDEYGSCIGQTPEYFFYYDLTYGIDPARCVITLKDGTVFHDNWFEYEGITYQANIDYEQRYDTRIKFGTNSVSGSVGGYDFTFAVEVIDTPVVKVEINAPIRVHEQNGYFTTSSLYDESNCYIGESPEYFHYYDGYLQGVDCTITLKDGTVIHDTRFDWNGLTGYVECYQNYDTRLLPGTNVIAASIANFEFTFEIEVLECVVASVKIPRVVLQEGMNGGYESDYLYDDYDNCIGRTPLYFCYYADFLQSDSCVITLFDGTVIQGSDFEWGGNHYSVSYEPQHYERQLVVGMNYMAATIGGYDFFIEVEVLPTPVASVEVGEVTRVQNANGSWTSNEIWDNYGNYVGRTPEYFHYDSILPADEDVTITMKDGTVIHGTFFEWEGNWYNVSTEYAQDYDGRLLSGSNTVFASVLGYTFYYEVEIIGSPVVKVEADPLRLVEHREGRYDTSPMYNEYGDWVGDSPEYFHYFSDRPDNLRIYLEDGTVVDGTSFEWDGEWYGTLYPDQSYDNQLTLGRNVWTATIAGYEFTYTIDVVREGENAYFRYLILPDGIVITRCLQPGEVLEIPATIDGLPVIEVTGLCDSDQVKHIVFPDSVRVMTAALGTVSKVESITFGSGIGGLTADTFANLWELKSVTVPADHPDYYTEDGSLYAADGILLFDSHREAPIAGWAVHDWPTKTEYYVGEELDLSGMTVVLWLADGSQTTVYRGFTAVGFDSSSPVNCAIDVYYRDTYLGSYWVYVYSCPHFYDNDCDPDCNWCGETRAVEHLYSYSCTPYCEKCGLPNENIVHSYLSDCHEVCYNCLEPRVPLVDHSYDDEYDADCNECGAVRDVTDQPQVVPGDTNGDGKVNNRDLGVLQQYLNDWEVEMDADAADVTGDGKVNNRDLGLLQQYLNDWDVTLK